MSYESPKKATNAYGVTSRTLKRWANLGKVDYIRTKGGQYRYRTTPVDKSRKKYIYGRVSSIKQENDLRRQIRSLKAGRKKHIIITDIASGINFSRKGLQSILEQVIAGNVDEIVVAYRDRLTRFGFELFEWLFGKYGTKIVVQNDCPEDNTSDLAEDLMSIITVFTAKYYGRRKYNEKNEKDIIHSEQEDEKSTDEMLRSN